MHTDSVKAGFRVPFIHLFIDSQALYEYGKSFRQTTWGKNKPAVATCWLSESTLASKTVCPLTYIWREYFQHILLQKHHDSRSSRTDVSLSLKYSLSKHGTADLRRRRDLHGRGRGECIRAANAVSYKEARLKRTPARVTLSISALTSHFTHILLI